MKTNVTHRLPPTQVLIGSVINSCDLILIGIVGKDEQPTVPMAIPDPPGPSNNHGDSELRHVHE